MTQEQKEKLEQKAKDYIKPFAHQLHLGADEGLIMDLVGFAQTILDNPGEWGLVNQDDITRTLEGIASVERQLTKYRKALETIAYKPWCHFEECIRIAKEAINHD